MKVRSKIVGKYKRYFYQLEVRMPDGEIIRHRYSTKTFCEVIEKIGVERIRTLDLTYAGFPFLDSISRHPYHYRPVRVEDYYLGMPNPVDKKAEILNEIAEGLGINLTAGIIREEKHRY